VIEILALDVDLGSAEHLRPALGVINGARATDVVLELVLEFGDEFRILPASLVGALRLVKRGAPASRRRNTPPYRPKCPCSSGRSTIFMLYRSDKSCDFRRVLDSLDASTLLETSTA